MHKQRITTQGSSCDEGAKFPVAQDQGCLCQCEASGATSTWVWRSQHLTTHTYTIQHKRKGRGPNPCTQSSTCGLVSSRAWCIGGASHGSLPHPHKVLSMLITKKKTLQTMHPLPLCPRFLNVHFIELCLVARVFLIRIRKMI